MQGVGQSHGGSAIPRLGVTEEGPNDRRGRGASGATEHRGCQPGRGAVGCQPVSNSRVPASGGGAVGCQPGEEFLAVRCQLKGQYDESGRNREGGGGRIASGLATTD